MEVKKKWGRESKTMFCFARIPPGDAFTQSVKQGHRRDPVLESRYQNCHARRSLS